MPKYVVLYTRTDRFEIAVEAENKNLASEKAWALITQDEDPVESYLVSSDGFEEDKIEETCVWPIA